MGVRTRDYNRVISGNSHITHIKPHPPTPVIKYTAITDLLHSVTYLIQRVGSIVKAKASLDAFAAIRADGSVVTWGLAFGGGDSSHVQELGEYKQ